MLRHGNIGGTPVDNPIFPSFQPFDTLYDSRPNDGDRFGPLGSTLYHPPSRFEPYKWYPVIELFKDAKSDGFNVTIMELRAPARFYRVVVHPTRNSVGTPCPGITLGTGSSAEKLAWTIATAFREGNLVPETT